MERVVVVGGGLAGLQSVIALRAQGYTGALTLLGAEPHRPYDRPPLSKAVLLGAAANSEANPVANSVAGPDTSLDDRQAAGPELDVTFDADWDSLDVDLRLGCRAIALGDRVVVTDAGPVEYQGLVIATGASPVVLPGARGLDSVHLLRTIEQARTLRAELTPGARVVVVGAGWIGAEVATAAARAGCRVTVVEGGATPLATALPPAVGAATAAWYAAAGVDLRMGTRVDRIEPGAVYLSGHLSGHLAGGDQLASDCTVLGIGVRPETGWLAGSPVQLDARGAVVVDSGLRTSVPGVFAVGDCATAFSPRFGRWLHVEHWDNALHSPAVAAANLLGGAEVYDPVPYFWSEQFGRMVQYAGYHPAGDTLVWRGSPAREDWTVCWLHGNRLVALLTVDRPRDLVQGRRLIAQARPVDPARLADPGVPLASR